MEYVTLGQSDLKVSRICMGCMGFGDAKTGQHSWTVDEETSKAIIKRSLELGINFYDTAIAYQAGTSEEYLGKAIKEYAQRDKVVIARGNRKWYFRKRTSTKELRYKSFSLGNGLC